MIRNDALRVFAGELVAAGFTVLVPKRQWSMREYLVYSRTVDGQVCWGTVTRAEGLADLWDHHMPITPSRANGSSMWIPEVPTTATLRVSDAELVARPFNRNPLVGRQVNDGQRFDGCHSYEVWA